MVVRSAPPNCSKKKQLRRDSRSLKNLLRGRSFLSTDTQLECFLRGAKFLAKNLRGAKFYAKNLRGAKFLAKNLRGLKITRKFLRGLKITRKILRGAKFPVPEGIRGMTFSSAGENKV